MAILVGKQGAEPIDKNRMKKIRDSERDEGRNKGRYMKRARNREGRYIGREGNTERKLLNEDMQRERDIFPLTKYI